MIPNFLNQFASYPLALEPRSVPAVLSSVERILDIQTKNESADGKAEQLGNVFAKGVTHDYFGNEIERARITTNGTAIIPLNGVVSKGFGPRGEYFGFTDVSHFTSSVQAAADDDDVRRIAIKIASPGGTVLATRDAAEIVEFATSKKRVMAYSDDLAASAAYYIPAAASEIVVGSGSIIGSIGVYTVFVDFTKAYEEYGVKALIVRSGDHKAIGAYGLDEASEENIAKVQDQIDALGEEFRGWVTRFRDLSSDDIQGQTFTGVEAVKHNFADSTANTFAEALRRFETSTTI